MNRVIINIGLIVYIIDSKYIVISIISITHFQEPRDYKYWTYKIYFKSNEFNQAVP